MLDKPRTFAAKFEREIDTNPLDNADNRLRVSGRLHEREDGDLWFRRWKAG